MAAEKHKQRACELIVEGIKLVIDCDKRWEKALIESKKHVNSFNYLHNQLTQCRRHSLDMTTKEAFPLLKENVMAIISEKMDTDITSLRATREDLRNILDELDEKQISILKAAARVHPPDWAVSGGISAINVAVLYYIHSLMDIVRALGEAQTSEVELPTDIFTYKSQSKNIQALEFKWKIYANT